MTLVKIVTLFILLLALTPLFSLVSAEKSLTSTAGVRYEQSIIDQFNKNETWVKIIIHLKDGNDPDNYLQELNVKVAQFHIKNIGKQSLSPDITAEVTEEGLNVLLNLDV